jgi:rhodanese-related sulfurtransferase
MGRFIEFIGNHWILSILWLCLFAALIIYLRKKSGRSLSTHETTLLVNRHNGVILDVRDKGDFDKGHIVNALNIPLAKLAERSKELDKHRESPLIVVDNMGHQSGEAVKLLQKAGYTQVTRLQGGMAEWRASNLPVVAK